MTYALVIDDWISIPNSWKIKHIDDRICRKFICYHFRPVGWRVVLAESSGPHKNEATVIEPRQSSLVIGLEPGFFRCITVVSTVLDKSKRLSLRDYDVYRNIGQAKLWYVSVTNLFEGSFDVFNGPNPIDLGDGK